MATTDAATFCATLVDEWVRADINVAFVAPGSRSTPMALALTANPAVALHLFHDERSAAFAALGHGLATGRPAVLLCTSGTAAAHFHAAVIEADLSSVPMLVCTADRPPELWDVGAPQTIDQSRLYGSSVRYFAEPGVPDVAAAHSWRSLASRVAAEATVWSGRPGPVHLNLSFRDPLVADAGALPPGRAGQRPWHEVNAHPTPKPPATPEIEEVVGLLTSEGEAVEGAIVAGANSPDPGNILALAELLGWPILADHRSGCRTGGNAITHFDALLRCQTFTAKLNPQVVLRFGESLASKALSQWLGATAANVMAITDRSRWSDPERVATTMLGGPWVPSQLLDALPAELTASAAGDRWRRADRQAAGAIDEVLSASDGEIGIARAVVEGIAPGGALVLSSSMPVRDVEWYGPNRADIDVYANRGANGIDGVISTAIGVALTGRPTTVLIGDVAFLHDSTALIALAQRDVDLHIVVVDNDGGGIFSFLPQATQLATETYEQLFGTPHGTDLAALAQAHGIAVSPWGSPRSGGVSMSMTTSTRDANLDLHERVNAAVAAALASA